MNNHICSICPIVPPHVLRHIMEHGNAAQRAWAFETLTVSEQFRGQREAMTLITALGSTPTGTIRRTIYDARNTRKLPGNIVRTEGAPPTNDVGVNEAYNGAGTTYNLYLNIYGRNSIDDRGMRLDSTVHYRRNYDNAFWNGQQMVYGDGDGQLFQRFTIAVDVIGHELTHGVTQFEAGLNYQDQPGALNESVSDVFGSLVKQYNKQQTADAADWLIGQGLFTTNVKGVALRSMKAPGTAYDDPVLGKDPQPAHMRDYVQTTEDNGGVHINSGIPNKAFYEVAIRMGGFAWEKVGMIWYVTLRDKMRPDSDFQAAANMTFAAAGQLYGASSLEQKAVRDGWAAVGITAQ